MSDHTIPPTSDSPVSSNAQPPSVMNRQTLIKRLLGLSFFAWLGSIFYPVVRFLIPPPIGESNVSAIKAGMIDDVWEKSFQIVQFGRTPVLFFKDGQGDYRALEATCSHLACIVQYRDTDESVWCACHNGIFDTTGKVVSGPPPAPLGTFAVNITEKGEIWISREAS